jgi:hypothetical protein
MNEQQLGFSIRTALDRGLQLSPEIAARLRVARERALDSYQTAAGELAMAGGGRSGSVRFGAAPGSWFRTAMPVAVLLAALIGIHQWQEARQAALDTAKLTAEYVDIDSGVLTGDLPIKAYLDEDFQDWLRQASD